MKSIVSLLLVALLAFAGNAFAASATVSWTNPTTNTDGSAIPAAPNPGSLTSTRVEYGSCAGTNVFGTKAGEITVAQPATSGTVTGLLSATTYCFRAFAKNTHGSESAASNVASKMTPVTTPNPPVLSSTITTAYDVRLDSWGEVKLGRAVGTMPLGTPCLDNPVLTNRGEYYEVAPENVRLIREPRSLILVTRCEWST